MISCHIDVGWQKNKSQEQVQISQLKQLEGWSCRQCLLGLALSSEYPSLHNETSAYCKDKSDSGQGLSSKAQRTELPRV